jgi:hypothetical protein
MVLASSNTWPAGHWKGLGPGLLRSVLLHVGCSNESAGQSELVETNEDNFEQQIWQAGLNINPYFI